MTKQRGAMKLYGRIMNGKIVYDYPQNEARLLDSLDGKRVKVAITKHTQRKPRSIEQNAYYWGVVVNILGNDLGYDPEEMHDALLVEHSLDRTTTPPKVKRTSTMTSEEMGQYIDRVIRWAAVEMGIIIPEAT